MINSKLETQILDVHNVILTITKKEDKYTIKKGFITIYKSRGYDFCNKEVKKLESALRLVYRKQEIKKEQHEVLNRFKLSIHIKK